jgi:hypothetical protein
MQVKRLLSTVTVTGPDVAVDLTGGGKAQISIFLTMDRTDFAFTGAGTTPSKARFAPGQYDCTATILAFDHNAVGIDYSGAINVGGNCVATTQGELPAAKVDGRVIGFTLEVK